MKNEYEVWRNTKGVKPLPCGSVVRDFDDLEVVYTPNGYRYQNWKSDRWEPKRPGLWLLQHLFLLWLGVRTFNWTVKTFF